MTPLIPALAGALLVAGLIGIVVGLRRTPEPPPAPQRARVGVPSWVRSVTPRTRILLLGRVGGWSAGGVADRLAGRGRRGAGRGGRPSRAALGTAGGVADRPAGGDGGVDPVAVGGADRRGRAWSRRWSPPCGRRRIRSGRR